MSKIGFTADLPKAVPAVLSERAVFQFDSGIVLTLDDLVHHLLVTGATGSGKTSSVAIPALAKLLALGCGGLIIDLKGNLRSKVRKLAAACGVQDKIVEFGTGDCATPLNLLSGMSDYEVNQFFEGLVWKSFHGLTYNMDFYMRGVGLAVDCVRLLRFLRGRLPGAEPNVLTVLEMLSDHKRGQELYQWFRQHVFNENNLEQAEFVQDVEGSNIHNLYVSKDVDSDVREEQLTYSLETIKTALRRFLDVPAVAEKFCASCASGLDMEREIRAGKIVLLRFDPDTGPVGEDLARFFVGRYYEAVYKCGLDLPWHTFVLMDEYQDIADLSDERLSDKRFLAMAREFKACVILLTQSLSALGSAYGNVAVDSLVANCNSRIMFYSDDLFTQEVARRYSNVDLTALEPQQAFVVRYDNSRRRHIHSLETVNSPYAFGISELARGEEVEILPAVVQAEKRIGLREMVGNLKENSKVKRDKKVCGKKIENKVTKEFGAKLVGLFPEVVADDFEVAVPVGWHSYIESALKALAESGLPARISTIVMEDGRLAFEGEGVGMDYLEGVCRGVGKICTICGGSMRNSFCGGGCLCEKCRMKFGFETGVSVKDDDEDELCFGRTALE